MKVQFAITNEELLKCRKAIMELRPNITSNKYLVDAGIILSEGAKMIYIEDGPEAPAVSVFRIHHYFYRGKNLYIDDLITLPAHRGKGYAGALIDFMIEYAKENKCDNIHLDSGYQEERWNAHRLYLNKGFHLASQHFTLNLK